MLLIILQNLVRYPIAEHTSYLGYRTWGNPSWHPPGSLIPDASIHSADSDNTLSEGDNHQSYSPMSNTSYSSQWTGKVFPFVK